MRMLVYMYTVHVYIFFNIYIYIYTYNIYAHVSICIRIICLFAYAYNTYNVCMATVSLLKQTRCIISNVCTMAKSKQQNQDTNVTSGGVGICRRVSTGIGDRLLRGWTLMAESLSLSLFLSPSLAFAAYGGLPLACLQCARGWCGQELPALHPYTSDSMHL
jgi:hypothetical protein